MTTGIKCDLKALTESEPFKYLLFVLLEVDILTQSQEMEVAETSFDKKCSLVYVSFCLRCKSILGIPV